MGGWAYVGAHLSTGSGPTGSLQYLEDDNYFTGSNRLVFLTSSGDPTGSATVTDHHTLKLTGTLDVSGSIFAHGMYVTTLSHKHVTVFSSSGASKFGDTADDLHQFTGTISIGAGPVVGTTPSISGAAKIGAGYFSSSGDYGAGLGSTIGGETLFSAPASAIKASGSITASVAISASGPILGQSITLAHGSINNTGIISGAASIVAGSTLSGAGAISGQNLVVGHGSISATGIVSGAASIVAGSTLSGAGAISGQNLAVSTTVVAGTAISGANRAAAAYFSSSGDYGAGLGSTFGGETLFSAPASAIKASGSITASVAISASGPILGQSITLAHGSITNTGIVSGAASIVAGSTLSGAGTISGQNLVVGHGSISATGIVSGAANVIAGNDVSASIGVLGRNLAVNTTVVAGTAISGANRVAGAYFSSSGDYGAGLGSTFGGETLFSAPFSAIKASGSITGSNIVSLVNVSGAGSLVGQSLTINNNEIINEYGQILGATFQYNVKPTGTINAAQVGFLKPEHGDMYINCSGGGVITLELPRLGTGAEDIRSGSCFFIKRAAVGKFTPYHMNHNVKIITPYYPGDNIDGAGEIYLTTPGASVQLITSGTSWMVF